MATSRTKSSSSTTRTTSVTTVAPAAVTTTAPAAETSRQSMRAPTEPAGSSKALRTAIMGLAGAGAGFGVAKIRKSKSPWIGAAVGGAAGAIGSLLLPAPEDKMYGTSVEGTEGASRTTSVSRVAPVKDLSTTQITAPGAGIRAVDTAPVGWLAYLIAHGGLCLNYEMHYMRKHNHVLPIMAPYWDTNSAKAKTDYSRNTLMTTRFCEWQCPLWDWQSPDFFGDNWGATDSTLMSIMHSISENDSGWKQQVGWPMRDPRYVDELTQRFADGSHPEGKKPARNVQLWISRIAEHSHQMSGKHFLQGTILLSPYANNKIEVPDYWKNSARLPEWRARITRWYWNAQWLVWACEMLRLHSMMGWGKGAAAPNWWISHAVCWGVPVPTLSTQQSRSSYVTRGISQGDPLGAKLALPMTLTQWEVIAKLVIQHTRVPGAPGTLGSQIVPRDTNATRALCDIPLGAGSIMPPTYLASDDKGAALAMMMSHWGASEEFYDVWSKYVMPIADTIGAIIMSAVGLGEIAAAMGTMKALFKCLISLVQTIHKLATGGISVAGDILSILGEITEAISTLTGEDISIVPDGLWDQLKTAGGTLSDFGGPISDLLREKAIVLQSNLTQLRDVYRWDYLDEAFGGLGLDANTTAYLDAT